MLLNVLVFFVEVRVAQRFSVLLRSVMLNVLVFFVEVRVAQRFSVFCWGPCCSTF